MGSGDEAVGAVGVRYRNSLVLTFGSRLAPATTGAPKPTLRKLGEGEAAFTLGALGTA